MEPSVVASSVVEGNPSRALPTLPTLPSCTERVDALPVPAQVHFRAGRGCVWSAELEFISHRSPPSAVLPLGAGKVFMAHPCSGLGTAGTASALPLSIPHIQGLGWARSREGTQTGQLTPTDQRNIPDPQLRSKSYGKEEERGALVTCICLPEQPLQALVH